MMEPHAGTRKLLPPALELSSTYWEGLPITRGEALSVIGETGLQIRVNWHPHSVALALAEILDEIIRDTQRRITAKEFRAFIKAYNAFKSALESLQDTDLPPPDLPRSESGHTDYDNWISVCAAFRPVEVGRRRRDDQATGKLLSLYGAAFIRKRGEHSSEHRLKFLHAVRRASLIAFLKARSDFVVPSAPALEKQLPALKKAAREGYGADARRKLASAQGKLAAAMDGLPESMTAKVDN